MKKQSYICDKCSKEIENFVVKPFTCSFEKFYPDEEVPGNGEWVKVTIDLCAKCREGLEKYLSKKV